MSIGIAIQAQHGQSACGDHVGYWHDQHSTLIALADGLGHGPQAAAASQAAIGAIEHMQQQPLEAIFYYCDEQLRITRGVALGLARIDHQRHQITYMGIGNIRALRIGEPHRRFVNSHGIVGGGFHTLFADCQPLNSGDVFILYSDGIEEIVDPLQLLADREDPQRMADRLLAELAPGHDDAAVLVYRA